MINKKQWVAIGVVLVLLIVFFVIRRIMNKPTNSESGYNGNDQNSRRPKYRCETNYIFDTLTCKDAYENSKDSELGYQAYKTCLKRAENRKENCISNRQQ